MKKTMFNIFKLVIAAAAAAAALFSGSCGIIIINNPGNADLETTDEPTIPGTTGTVNPGVSDSRPDTAETRPPEPDADEYLASLPALDMDGARMLFVCADPAVMNPGGSENEYQLALIKRNTSVEDKYNCEILFTEPGEGGIYRELSDEIKAGLYYADVIAIPYSDVGLFYSGGLLLNLRSLPFWNMSAPYRSEEAAAAGGGHYGIYADTGAAGMDPGKLYGVFFNRGVIEGLGLESPYDLVYSGRWTWDKLLEYSAAASAIDGFYTGAGHATARGEDEYADIIFASSGEKFLKNNPDGIPEVDYYSDRVAAVMELINRVIHKSGTMYRRPASATDFTALQRFHGGEILFYTGRLEYISWIYDSGSPWGLLPAPKSDDEQQAYHSPADSSVSVLAVPSNNNKIDYTGMILEALGAASAGKITDAYISYNMHRFLRDNSSVNMLDIIINSASFDLANALGPAYQPIANATYGAVRASTANPAYFHARINTYIKSANNDLSKIFS